MPQLAVKCLTSDGSLGFRDCKEIQTCRYVELWQGILDGSLGFRALGLAKQYRRSDMLNYCDTSVNLKMI